MPFESTLKAEATQRQHDRAVDVYCNVAHAISQLQVARAYESDGEKATRIAASISHLRESSRNILALIDMCESE